MSQSIQIACPHCTQNLKVAGAAAGKQVQCPKCHGFVSIPDVADPQSPTPPRWSVRAQDGKTYGPVSREELEQWIQEGRVHSQCHISAEGAQQWIWAAEMFPHLTPVQPATPAYDQAYQPPSPHNLGPFNLGPQSDKSRLVAGLLGLLLPLVGIYGVHRLYTGHIGLEILMLITCGGWTETYLRSCFTLRHDRVCLES